MFRKFLVLTFTRKNNGLEGRTMDTNKEAFAQAKEWGRKEGKANTRYSKCDERHIVDLSHGGTVAGHAGSISSISNLSSVFSAMEKVRSMG
jgi:hypothetical protein